MAMFRSMFGSFSAPHIVRQNNFSNFQLYFLQKTLPVAMAGLRTVHGICPTEVIRFLVDLFKYNDNSRNHYSDNYYRAALVDALGHAITPVISVLQQGAPLTAENLSADAKLILEDVTRLLNMEKHLPSYKYSVTVSCLKVIRKLQKCGHLPPSSKIYRSYAAYGQYVDVRVAALECLVDFVKNDGKSEDLEHLLDLIESDPDPMVKHRLLRLLIENPPFERAHQHRLDRPHLVERLWTQMNQLASYDSKLRCDLVDFYYMLYGIKKPIALSNKEIAEMLKPPKSHRDHHHHERSSAASSMQPIPKIQAEVNPEDDPNRALNAYIAGVESSRTGGGGGGSNSMDGTSGKRKLIEYEGDDDIFGSASAGGTGGEGAGGSQGEGIKVETMDEVVITDSTAAVVVRGVSPLVPEIAKKIKADNYYSDNSISLPGLVGKSAGSHPVGFEPGMFQSQDDAAAMRLKAEKKKKKKEKKKHKHKHKHKHNKDKDREKGDRSMKEKKDPNMQRLLKQEDTMSSAESSNSTMDMTM